MLDKGWRAEHGLSEEGSGVRGLGSLPIHPHIDPVIPSLLGRLRGRIQLSLLSICKQSPHIPADTQKCTNTCWANRISQAFHIFCHLKKTHTHTLSRMWMRRRTLRMDVRRQPVRVWASYPPLFFPLMKCRLCWWATAQVHEWSSEAASRPPPSPSPSSPLAPNQQVINLWKDRS